MFENGLYYNITYVLYTYSSKKEQCHLEVGVQMCLQNKTISSLKTYKHNCNLHLQNLVLHDSEVLVYQAVISHDKTIIVNTGDLLI